MDKSGSRSDASVRAAGRIDAFCESEAYVPAWGCAASGNNPVDPISSGAKVPYARAWRRGSRKASLKMLSAPPSFPLPMLNLSVGLPLWGCWFWQKSPAQRSRAKYKTHSFFIYLGEMGPAAFCLKAGAAKAHGGARGPAPSMRFRSATAATSGKTGRAIARARARAGRPVSVRNGPWSPRLGRTVPTDGACGGVKKPLLDGGPGPLEYAVGGFSLFPGASYSGFLRGKALGRGKNRPMEIPTCFDGEVLL
ncbi:hypothetical protein DQ04_01621050 [Trypanosoma grayi]|uniref:hypothetical protein n=1 Tax=Trypanosoma grayi TaxID=71804 RepID=UPI0004F48E31|nr:hypothetical protein DQ04_01621050 [Trypanosoma grayi]KEG12552.1 hypothetical protein DQ04_01621050 [Trypanosoma grayi]